MKQLLLTFILFWGLVPVSRGQFSASGKVTDEDGNPLVGASVTATGDRAGALTDENGGFNINTKDVGLDSLELFFSYYSYNSASVVVKNGQKNILVTLTPKEKKLDAVVITALGVKRQEKEIGYSTTKIDGDAIALSNAPNLVNALSGKAAGVQISTPNGVDGGTTRITIRGNNNIRDNNQPLIVVDGVPLENAPGLENIGRGVDWGSAINNINPDDIQDINILKGPTAAALYGARGANGVVLITTKRGFKQKGIGIQYTVNYKVIQPYRYRDVQNVYGAGGPVGLTEPEFSTNAAGEFVYPTSVHTNDGPFGKSTTELFGFYSTGASWGPEMLGQMVRWWDGEMRDYSPQPDNLSLYFHNGHTTTQNLAFSGGGEMGSVRFSFSNTGHSAVIPNSTYDQTTANIGAKLNISSKVTADLSLSYINYKRLNSPTLGDDNNKSFGKGILYSWPRSYKGLEKEINILPDGTRNNYNGQYPFTFTPPHLWWNTYHQNTTLTRNKVIGALSLNYEITSWLTAMARIGLDFNLDQFETRNDPVDAPGILEGFYSNELTRNQVNNHEFLITAEKEKILGSDLDIRFSVGGTQWQRRLYGIKGQSGTWVNPWLFNFNNYQDQLSVPIPSEVRYDKNINSLYAFLNLGFKDYLFVELTGRNDWSSALPIENNSYFYPSVSGSFIASEAFNFSSHFLNYLKFRAAYAQTASDTDPFQVDFVYTTGTFGNAQTAALPTTIPPIALRPQQANSYELGTSIGLWDDKLSLDFTYYYILSFDQILDAPLPASSGASQIKINTGKLENKGIEAALTATIFKTQNSFWRTSFNIARNRNYVVSLGDGAEILELANIWDLNGPAIAVRAGEEYGTIIGYDYVYHENGQPILNEEGTHYLISNNRVPIGNASPDFIGGWQNQVRLGDFTLQTLVDFKWGGDIYAGSYVIGLQTGQSPETLVERQGGGLPYTDPGGATRNVGVILDGVYADGTPNDKVVHYYFKYIPNAGGWGHFLSKPGIMENTWVKMRELSLSYSVPGNFLQKTKIFQSLDLSVVGRDLFYLYTSLPDRINPEGINGAGNAQGLEWASYPGMRSVSLRAQANF
ncbi:MAG: SusC/RagA family TonB-linked outer membrane protein [Bacteroidia bacterium]